MKIGTCPICRADIQGFNQVNKAEDENKKIYETETCTEEDMDIIQVITND
jgi:hypothetical protein